MTRLAALMALMVGTTSCAIHAQEESRQDNIVVLDVSGGTSAGSFQQMVYRLESVPLISTGDIVSMLGDSGIHSELELMPGQQKQLKDIRADFDKLIQDIRRQKNEGESELEKQARQKEIEKAYEDRKRMMEEVLLPHQRDRLHQVSLQMKMSHRGDLQMLTGDELAELLGINDEQKEKLKKRSKEIQAEMQAEIAKAKERARKKLMQELTPGQRERLQEMLGDTYEKSNDK